MGVKDIEEKQFEDYNDVFADIVNVLVFGGKQVVKPEALENSKDKSRFKAAKGRITEQERDVSKWWRKSQIRLALFGIENQTAADKKICFKLYGYDGASYKSQYDEKTNYPVITLVLHFDYKNHWKGPKTLLDSMTVPEELKPYVNDYHMNLFEIAWLTNDQIKMFKSDFRIVADYFTQMRKNKEYIPDKTTIKHVDAVLKLMAALTGDYRFEDAVDKISEEERRQISMCEFWDKVENRGIKKGRIEGKKEGRFENILQVVNAYIAKKNLTQKAACEDLSIKYSEYMAAKRYMKKISAQN